MTELNPNHPVTESLRDQWHKICAIVMHKLNVSTVDITTEDMSALADFRIAAYVYKDSITLSLMSISEGERLAKEVGGRVV